METREEASEPGPRAATLTRGCLREWANPRVPGSEGAGVLARREDAAAAEAEVFVCVMGRTGDRGGGGGVVGLGGSVV